MSIVFAIIVLDAYLPGSETLTATVAWTVIFSIVAHGLTASPLANAFARHGDRSCRPSNINSKKG